MKTNEERKLFYQTCASILDIQHNYTDPVRRRTRWNNRLLGNGRYPGFGLVQCFGSQVRVISKNGTKMFKTYDETYKYLESLK